MAWERRGRNKYFYRSARRGRSVRKTYLGQGEAAKRAAAEDAAATTGREADRAELRRLQTLLDAPEQLAGQLKEQIGVLTAAFFLADGFHNHKGEWRRRRDKST